MPEVPFGDGLTGPLELFSCEPYQCRLTRKACLERQKERTLLDAQRYTGEGHEAGLRCSRCTEACEAGEVTRKLLNGGKPVSESTRARRSITRAMNSAIFTKKWQTYRKKRCIDCNRIFQPTGGRSVRCEPCRERR